MFTPIAPISPDHPDYARVEELADQYLSLLPAVQTGVRWKLEAGLEAGTSAKHVRTGINLARAGHGALVALLIQKGLFTELEYFEALVYFLEEEVKSYEREASAHLGPVVTFH